MKFKGCVTCGGPHNLEYCLATKFVDEDDDETEELNYARPTCNQRKTQHPGFDYGSNKYTTNKTMGAPPPGFQNQQKEPSLKDLVNQLALANTITSNHINQLVQAQNNNKAQLNKLTTLANAQKATNEQVAFELKELKTQIGKVYEVLNERDPEKFPSGTVNPHNVQLKAIHLWSGLR